MCQFNVPQFSGAFKRLRRTKRLTPPRASCPVGSGAAKDLLFALGTDFAPGAPAQPGIAKYKIIEASDSEPAVLNSHRVFPRGEGQASCIAAYCSGRRGLVAVGTDAALQLFRAQDIVQEKPYPVTLTLEDGAGNQEVTSIEFLEQGSRVILFACTRKSVCSWRVWDGSNVVNQEIRLLNLDAAGGASPSCARAFPGMNALLVAKADAIFAYDPEEGNMSAMPLDGDKVLLERFKSYLAVVTSDTMPPFATASSMPKQTVTVVLAQKGMRFIAFTSQFTDVTHVVSAQERVYLVSRGGADGNTVLFELREKPLEERLDVLKKKRMFEWAAEVALTSDADPEARII
ncbi:unnamed protein product [Effrenium voratum]|nr:unnamed protein product [Effrenium voratum]